MGQEPKKTGFPVARDEDGAFSLYIRYYISQSYFLTFEKTLFVAQFRLTDSKQTASNSPHKVYSEKVSDSISEWFGWCFYCCQPRIIIINIIINGLNFHHCQSFFVHTKWL